jgi:Helix-turn-helix domain
MRIRHQGRRQGDYAELRPPQPGFTPYECVTIYWLSEQGFSQRTLAENLDCSKSTIFRAIRRGRDTFHYWDVPRLLALAENSNGQCPHNRPIQVGERVVCCTCFVSGYDDVDAMQVTAADLRQLEATPEPQELAEFAERMHGGKKKKAKK